MVNKGNASRTERLPTRFEDVSADWLTRTLQGQYPGIVVEEMKLVELIAGHTTKARVEVKLNQAGVDAGIPRQLCLKANWSGSPLSSPVCVNEARFYKEFPNRMNLPTPKCYFADWDDDSAGQPGLIILEDMENGRASCRERGCRKVL